MHITNHRPGCNTKPSIPTVHTINRSLSADRAELNASLVQRAIQDERLDRAALKILCSIVDAAEAGEIPARGKLAASSGISKKSVSNYLSLLRSLGYLAASSVNFGSHESEAVDPFEHHLIGIGDRKFTRFEAWLWLSTRASDGLATAKVNGELVTIESGQLLASRSRLAFAWRWSEQSVRTFLRHLSAAGLITCKNPQSAIGVISKKAAENVITVLVAPDLDVGSLLIHPIVGVENRSYSNTEAWFFLQSMKPGFSRDLARVWAWTPHEVRSFVNSLIAAGMLSSEAGLAALSALPSTKGVARTPIGKPARQVVWEKTDGKCVYCGIALTLQKGQPNSFHADHVLSAKSGGTNDVANLVPSCAACNMRKAAKPFLAFIAEMEASDA
jgi:hypothetical protein